MHSFHNILISKSALVFLEQLQGRIPFLISYCIHDADSSSLGSLFVWILSDLISNGSATDGGSTRHQRYWFGAEGWVVWWGGEINICGTQFGKQSEIVFDFADVLFNLQNTPNPIRND